MKYKMADVVVEFEPIFDLLKTRTNKYKIQNSTKSDFEIVVKDESIQKEIEMDSTLDAESAEYMIAGTIFYRELLKKNGCLLHSSAVVVDDEAYLFSANCGTGKSTHTSLWLKYLADKNPYILNDDKPAIRVLEDGIYAYGTPFSGKYDMNENKKVKLKAICFLEQSEINFIRKVDTKEAIKLFLEQTIRRLKEENMNRFLDILEQILKEIPIYKLYCNISEEAVQLSYRTLRGDANEN